MNVGINEFLLKRKTIAFDFNFDREGKKKVYSPFTCLEDLKKKKKKLAITDPIKHIITVHITQIEDNFFKKIFFF